MILQKTKPWQVTNLYIICIDIKYEVFGNRRGIRARKSMKELPATKPALPQATAGGENSGHFEFY